MTLKTGVYSGINYFLKYTRIENHFTISMYHYYIPNIKIFTEFIKCVLRDFYLKNIKNLTAPKPFNGSVNASSITKRLLRAVNTPRTVLISC